MRQHQLLYPRRQRHLRRLARRRMARLLGPLLFFLAERRLVHQQIRPRRRVHDRRARPGIARDDHLATGTRLTDDAFRSDRPTVRQSDSFTTLQLPPQRSLRHPKGLSFRGIESPEPLLLDQRVPDRPAPVFGREYAYSVRATPYAFFITNLVSRPDFPDFDSERHPFHSQLDRALQQLLRALRPVQLDRLLAPLQPQRPEQPDHSQKMIGVKVR